MCLYLFLCACVLSHVDVRFFFDVVVAAPRPQPISFTNIYCRLAVTNQAKLKMVFVHRESECDNNSNQIYHFQILNNQK